MRRTAARLVYSPSDLCRFMESSYAVWMDRYCIERPGEFEPGSADESLELIFEKGREHEQAFLDELRRTREVVEPRDAAETIAAMNAGAEVIYQAHLAHGEFAGVADFLFHVDGHYEVWDTKLARHTKPYFLIQLCCYAEMLEGVRGTLPAEIGVVLGTNERQRYRTSEYFSYYRALKRSFLEFMHGFDASSPPEPESGADHGRWQQHADDWFEARDHLSRVANIQQAQIKKLVATGISTLRGLAETTERSVPRLDPVLFARLKRQARLQLASSGLERPLYELASPERGRGLALLPPPSSGDVYFDIEGDPLYPDGLEYLLGASYYDASGSLEFRAFWAHNHDAERRSFEEFIDWVWQRRHADPQMHIYHYAPYEKTALRRLMGRYGTREHQVDELLRAEVFVDLYTVVRQGLFVGEPAYSLKNIEHLYRAAREGEVVSAAGSIVMYERWRETQDPDVLEEIRSYNQDDCDSTAELAAWLRERQAEASIEWTRAEDEVREETEPPASALLAADLLARSESPLDELLAHLLEFHRREDKPVWWALFDRAERTEQELYDDFDCLAGLALTDEPPVPIKKSTGYWYRFDPDQDSKVSTGSYKLAADIDLSITVEEQDRQAGRALLKFGPKALGELGGRPPARLALIPGGPFNTKQHRAAIESVARAWFERGELRPALRDLFLRRRPNLGGAALGSDLPTIALNMRGTCLCVQGPPGAGKTYQGAHTIAALLRAGKRVGILSNSHRAIENLMEACYGVCGDEFGIAKVGGPDDAPLYDDCPGVTRIAGNTGIADAAQQYPLIGATAWGYVRPDMEDALDYLFIDEAGQVSLANVVAVARSARNLVLLGDQMQLGQPIQGTHPGESGSSALEYLLQGRATIPTDMGVFLDQTWRLHPDVCHVISDCVYEGRLTSAPVCEQRVVRASDPMERETGIVFVPVTHEGNRQASDEEVARVADLVAELVGRARTDSTGCVAGTIALEDLLLVAPFNMQVRALQERLGTSARVGSVDKFQGQEAPIVILSMCASAGDQSSRGIEFLFDRQRLNVALSRAQSLAFVVGHPRLARTRCSSVEQMRLVNFFARVVEESLPPPARFV